MMTLPALEDPCGGCGHAFGLHWITHDGNNQGCLQLKEEATEEKGVSPSAKPCSCRGFTVRWTPQTTVVIEMQQPSALPQPPIQSRLSEVVQWERQ